MISGILDAGKQSFEFELFGDYKVGIANSIVERLIKNKEGSIEESVRSDRQSGRWKAFLVWEKEGGRSKSRRRDEDVYSAQRGMKCERATNHQATASHRSESLLHVTYSYSSLPSLSVGTLELTRLGIISRRGR